MNNCRDCGKEIRTLRYFCDECLKKRIEVAILDEKFVDKLVKIATNEEANP